MSRRTIHLRRQPEHLQQELKKIMRGFGRQCRGQGRVFVTLVRHTERQLLALGQPIQALGQQAQQLLDHANDLQDAHRQRWTSELHAAMKTQEHIRKQSERLTQGKKLSHCKIVNAQDATIAPSSKGRAIALLSLAANLALCRSLPRALSLPIVYPRVIRAIPAMCCPCSTRSKAPSTVSVCPNGSASTQ